MAKARKMPEIGLYDWHVSTHRAWPWDTDLFGELNNGRILTLFELGRWAAGVRMGMIGKAFKGGIMFPIAGVSVRYRKRVPVFQTYRMQTRFLGFDAQFVYVEQSMWQGDTCMNQMLLRFAVKTKKGTMKPLDFMDLLGLGNENHPLPDWALNWIEADKTRPWPPTDGPIAEN